MVKKIPKNIQKISSNAMFLSIEIYLLTFLELNKILSSIKNRPHLMPHYRKLG